jgi:hypothetical protein
MSKGDIRLEVYKSGWRDEIVIEAVVMGVTEDAAIEETIKELRRELLRRTGRMRNPGGTD